MITREQVADLQPGDVVELTDDRWPDVVTRGSVHESGGYLWLGDVIVRDPDPRRQFSPHTATLTVVSRAPRQLYVNSDRTEPVQGDVVRFEDLRHPEDSYTNLFDPSGVQLPWLEIQTGSRYSREEAEPTNRERFRVILLVDGTTGQAVTS